MKFAFLIHPLNAYTKLLLHLGAGGFFAKDRQELDLFDFYADLHNTVQTQGRTVGNAASDDVRVVDEMTELVSHNGCRAAGRIYEVPMQATEIIDNPQQAVGYMEKAVDQAADWGAELVGLGSMTGVVGSQGVYLANRGTTAITTGNCLTAYATLENLRSLCEDAGIDLADEIVTVVGCPGSIAMALAHALVGKCRELHLVARRSSARSLSLAEQLGAKLLLDIPEAVSQSRVILSATSSGDCIDQAWLQPGSVVLDVAIPSDVVWQAEPRPDVLVISAGLATVPQQMIGDSILLGFYGGLVPSCLGETIILALENRPENYSVGRDLDPKHIQEIGQLAHKHGFDFTRLTSFGLPIAENEFTRFRKIVTQQPGARPQRRPAKADVPTNALPDIPALAQRARQRYQRYVNPVWAALGGESGLVKTFVRGEGAFLYDDADRRFLDFVAGYGSVNLGHNHPAVVEALNSALAQKAPGFAQTAVNPLTAALAERLISITPGSLELAFFTNSGAESVEAALKLARAATGRTGLLGCAGGYHGKTIGALSVTHNPHYQRPFSPLLADTAVVPFGDLETLERALSTRRFAAFIVEPIQGEGGMNLPPAGYLAEALKLCQAVDTLLIVDEVQTGLGRTGELFAVNHDGVEPDIMTLAKSLGGGLVPLGAMLARRDLWMKAYGTLDSFALHTSTFSGGSLACAAGLATLDVLCNDNLADCARRRGQQLMATLTELCRHSTILQAVRGQGLMIGLEFKPISKAIAHQFERMALAANAEFMVHGLDDLIRTIPVTYVMATLLHEHGIYTQFTRSNPNVLRVQPPLIVTERQADHFCEAVEQACSECFYVSGLAESVLSKSIGDHRNQ